MGYLVLKTPTSNAIPSGIASKILTLKTPLTYDVGFGTGK